jgi:hypothetical protein
MRSRTAVVWLSLVLASASILAVQKPPEPDITAVAAAAPLVAGTTAKVSVSVKLPEDIHLQSDKPRDKLLIATELTLKPPAGLALDRIVFPKPTDLAQPGRKDPLTVFSGTFTIDVFLKVAADARAGEVTLPAQLRYQACDASVCFAPARRDVQWTLRVTRP